MTVLVGILCQDGVVIGADSSATFSVGGARTIEQPTKKLCVIRDQLIVACTGAVGLAQRFERVCETLHEKKELSAEPVEIGKRLSAAAIADFIQTQAHVLGQQRPNQVPLGAIVAGWHGQQPYLIEFEAGSFQPEVKAHKNNQLWFVSMGSGQPIADPFLALLRRSIAPDGSPRLPAGKFMAAWVLHHVCDTNPGGVKEPYHMAVIEVGENRRARLLDSGELEEHAQAVTAAYDYLRDFPAKAFNVQNTRPIPE